MRNFLCLLICLVLLHCKNNDVKTDIVEISNLHNKAYETKSDSALVYINEAKYLIDRNDNLPDSLKVENMFRRGYYYKQNKDLDSASYYFHRAVDLIKAPNSRARNLIYFRNTWQTDIDQNNYKNAIATIQRFIEITNPESRQADIQFAYNALQLLYYDLGNVQKELEYSNLASDSALKAHDTDMYVVTKSHSAHILARDYTKTKEALQIVDSLCSLDVGLEAKHQLYRTIGIVHYYDGNYPEALKNYNRSLSIAKEVDLNHDNNLLEAYSNIAEVFIDIKAYEEAKTYLDSAKAHVTLYSPSSSLEFFHELLIRHNNSSYSDKENLANQFKSLIEITKRQYEKRMNQELTDLKLANIGEQQALAQKNKVELDIIKLWSALGLLGLFILAGYLFYRQRQLKFERESLQMQQRLLRSQMNPHFVFNTLSVIQNQIKENKDDAINYLIKFSRLLRLILENSLNDYVELEDELASLRKYLDLQLFRFPNKFRYTIDLENIDNPESIYIPPMLIQPFVENSIEHGFLGIDYVGILSIRLSLKNKWITCEIEDNGIGINDSNSELKNSISVNLISRFIKKTTKQDINIIDKKSIHQEKSGVLVKFLIPYKF